MRILTFGGLNLKKSPRKKPEKIDGLSPKDVEKIRSAIRKVWMWSYPRRLAKERCKDENGFFVCELCSMVTPTIHIDHIVPVGNVDAGFIERLYCPSSGLQSLCARCHNDKTKEERKRIKN